MFVRSSWLLLWGTIVWASAEPVTLHIGGTFPMESGSGGWAGGEACLPAVEMALKDVNSRLDILPGYVLNMTNHNSQCQPGLAMQQLYDFLYKPPTKLMLLTGCSPVTTVIAEAAPVWKLVVLSYGGSSPALSNRNRFPTLFRTHPSANMQNPTRIHIMEKFKWKRFTILMSVEEVFVTTAKDLEAIARKKGIKVDRQSFYGDPTDAMKTLQRQDARIIVGLFYVTEARKVLCQAYHHGLYGRRYVWFFIGWYADTWYIPPPEEHLNCTAEQMTEAAEYHFTTESVMLSRDNIPAISEMTGMQFQQRLTQYFQKDTANVGGFPEAPLAYDAVWALALAFNCTRNNLPSHIRLENFTYDNKVIADTLFQCVKNTSFRGVSGKVMFSDSGDRIARTQIEQMQGGKYKIMGYYDTTSGDLEWYNKEQWLNGKGPPPDSTVIKKHAMTVSNEFYYPTILFAVLGIAACVFIYLFTQKHHERLIIFQSQPECNNILLIGCSLCLFSLFLIGLPSDDISISESLFPLLCHARVTILLFGFTFAYGSMFAKVWIVHRMGATENQQLASRQKDELKPLLSNFSEKPISSSKFYVIVAALTAVDVFVCFVWVLIDPLHLTEQKFPLFTPADSEEDEMIMPVLQQCQSNQQEVWIGIIMGFKCLLLVFGTFLSYETRNLKLRFINDSRFVGLAIYNVAVMTLVTAPVVTLLIHGKVDANFAFISLTVLICTYISVGLIYGPKIRHIIKVPPSADEIQLNGNVGPGVMSKVDQKRYDMLKKENETLQIQIEEKERKIHECKERLEELTKNSETEDMNAQLLCENDKQIADENLTYSTATTLTTTIPLIDLQNGNHPGQIYENDNDDDGSSTSSDEILL
ncbi:G-protein coupled receptors family 3 profile domain-containing protein [Caenorhabditis elegans]|uniref:G-protein coupled receptors family 3 profile domain-containing protein n=1 Tax=Caenorhabditis elegans TaxID=6239 RepID=A0A0K3ATD8_CAEEL|nr:G-protein coupled receptors family 3 profile domain-containing protein [Caenorhabditis elegans]CTQ87096.1 G-protein coupled receptors family 3 profile domain-containing protein [Caenorhabditis elegans]|eukprot:NP_001300385.1 Gamma-aminobutyric acid type B receptor subunit 1 [Caenorhabditis elegans]